MMNMTISPELDELVEIEIDLSEGDIRDLIVHNDDHNTFDHVINTLVRVCKHDVHQAEQCTYLIHYKGKCAVKKGSIKELKPMKDALNDAGISATIE
ncbi:MAG: ATP-dependent Clp protease adaptor protein ClpS [Marinoscillum sp.]|jgi:ATP-dependent Clp protease adaptor protein ClpS